MMNRRTRPKAHSGCRAQGLLVMVVALGPLAVGCKTDEEAVARKVEARLEKKMRREVAHEVRRQLLASRGPGARAVPSETAGPPGLPTASPEPRRAAASPAAGMQDEGGAARPSSASGAAAAPPAPSPNGPPPKVTTDEQGLTVAKVVAARRVVERKPDGVGSSFSVGDGRVYCFVDARNPKGPERKLQVVWQHQGRVFHKVRLRVGVGHIWRTWAYVRLRPAHVGAWRCTVRNEQGAALGSADFLVTADGGEAAAKAPVRSAPRRRAPPSPR